MKEEELNSEDSNSTVLLTNYNDKPEKNEVKKRRMSNLYERLHSDQYEDENKAPNDLNVNGQTNTSSGRKKGRNWRVSRYFASIGGSNLQNNCQQNHARAGNLEDEIICLDSDDDSDVNGKNQQPVVKNDADFNKPDTITNTVEQGLITAKLTVHDPVAINAGRATVEIFENNDMISNSDNSQKLFKNKPMIRILKPSVINARTTTNEPQSSTSNMQDRQIICDTIDNQDTDKVIDEQEKSDLFDKQGIQSIQNISQTRKIQYEGKTGEVENEQELSSILVGDTASEIYSSQEIIKTPVVETTCEPFNKQKTGRAQDLQPQIMDQIRDEQNTKEIHQSKPNSNEKIEEQTKKYALDKHVTREQNQQVLGESQNKLVKFHTREEPITSKVFDSYGTGKVRDERIKNAKDKPEACEQYDMQATGHMLNEKGTYKVQDNHETGENQVTSTVHNGSNTMNTQDKHKHNNEKDNDIVIIAHENRETSKEPTQAMRMLNKDEARKGQDDDRDVSVGQDSQNEKIISQSEDKVRSNIVSDERKTTESHNGQDRNKRPTVKVNLLQFQIDFFTITKAGVHPEFALSFDNIIRTLKANHARGTHQTELLYCCPMCSHVSSFSSSLPDTNTEEPIDKDRSQKCVICSGIRKLYFTYMRRYISKNVCTNDKDGIANGSATAKDRIQHVEHSDKSYKRKSNEPNEESTDPKRMKGSTDLNNVQNDKHLSTNMSKDNISATNANLGDKVLNSAALNVQNAMASNNSGQKRHPRRSYFEEIEESRHEGTEANANANNVTNKNVLRRETRDNELNLNETEMSKSNPGLNQNCSAIVGSICDNTREVLSKEPTSESQMNTSNLNENVYARNIDQNDENSSNNNDRENNNAEKSGDIENQNNAVSNEIQKKATETPDTEAELNNEINIVDSKENNAINERNIKSLSDCFTKITNMLSPNEKESNKREQQKNNTPLTISERKKSIDKIPDGSIDNRADVEYICHVCSCIYVYPYRFITHLKQHNIMSHKIPENCIRRKCKHCNLIFKCKESFNKHVRKHHSNKYTETVAENLSIHNEERVGSSVLLKKTSTHQYHCTLCAKILKTDYAARNHRKQKHPELSYQKLYRRIAIDDQNHEQGKINNCENEELHESEDDSQDPTYVDATSGDEERSRSACSIINLDEFEESSDSDDSSICDGDALARGEIKDDQTNQRNKRDKTERKISNANEDFISENESEAVNTCSNECTEINDNDKLKRRIYKCSLCKITFSSDWSARKHRMNKHPDMKGAPLFEKKYLYSSTNSERNSCSADSTHVSENDSSSSSESEEVIQNSLRSHSVESEKSNNTDKTSRNINLARCLARIDEVNDAEKYTETEKCNTESTPGYNEEKEVASDHETINASESTIRKNKRTTKLFDYDDNDDDDDDDDDDDVDDDDDGDDDDERQSDVIVERTDTEDESQTPNNMDTERAGSADETIKASEKAVEKKKERLSKLFGDESVTSEDGSMKPSEYTLKKRKERIKSFLADENEALLQDAGRDCNQNDREDNANDESDRRTINFDTNQEVVTLKEHIVECNDDARAQGQTSDDEINNRDKNKRKISNTSEKKTIESKSVADTCSNNDIVMMNDNKLKGHVYECLLCKVTFPSNWSAYKHRLNKHENLRGTQLFKKIQLESCTGANDVKKPTEIDKCIKSSERTGKHDVDEARAKTRENDHFEIDMINNLLEEYDSRAKEDQRVACNEEENSNRVDPSQVSKDKMQINDDGHNKVQDKICLEKVQITNITSCADKIYLFVCQECEYATDIYDDTIRHCQNHVNQIQDPVIYCNVCQINYDSSCFERHEVSHDKYLAVNKVEFSFQWLFSKWHLVFENNNMPLSVAEDVQVKSIYKTFSVKMTVKEDGAWHSALYLCAKCNTCVPPTEIEKHVRQKCPCLNYLCAICERPFLTYEMREHHKIYHNDDNSKIFKIIVFNDKNDEEFNMKLLRAKTGRTNDQGRDIFKCLCGLCFGSLKKFKLHFLDCESESYDGEECPECSISCRFSPEELHYHLSLHASGKYDFKVQKITFQVETNNDSFDETIVETPDGTDNTLDVLPEHSIIKRDMLKEGILSQQANANNIHVKNLTTIKATEADRQIKRNLLKSEVLSQEYSSQERTESVNMTAERDLQVNLKELLSQETIADEQLGPSTAEDVDNDLQIKRDLLKESPSQQTIADEQLEIPRPTASEDVNMDLQVKRDLLKESPSQQTIADEQLEISNNSEDVNMVLQDKTDSQQTIADEQTEISTSEDVDIDLQVKRDLLKDEILSQETTQVERSEIPTAKDVDRELQVKKDLVKDESLSKEPMSVEESDGDVDKGLPNRTAISNEQSNSLEIVDEPVELITIGDSDSDSDIEYIG